MKSKNWERQFGATVWLVHYLYVTPLIIVGFVYFLFPPISKPWTSLYDNIFYGCFLAAVLTLPVATWLYKQLASFESLEMRFKGVGFQNALNAFRVGMMVCGFLGDLTATIGIAYFIVTRNPDRLWYFMGIWGIHYVLVTLWLRKGQEDLTLLGKSKVSPPQSARRKTA